MEDNGIHIRVARCSNCSLNADTAAFGYFLSVNNCTPKVIDGIPTHVCDVVINNRNKRYECRQIDSISDCVDRITTCINNITGIDFDNPVGEDEIDIAAFCNSPIPDGETHTEFGEAFYIQDGHILWNLQVEVSKCGTARTSLFNSDGNSWPADQQPNCLPYSDVFMSNSVWDGKVMTCPSGEIAMMEKVCDNGTEFDDECTPPDSSNLDCCVSSSNCKNSVLTCEALKDTGVKICEENEGMKQCGNPCATVVNIPPLEDGTKDDLWQAEMCEFFCPNILVQNFWFGDPEDDTDYEDPDAEVTGDPRDRYKSRICSEEYFNLCRLAGCQPDEECKSRWGEQQDQDFRSYPTEYPTVYKIP